MATTPLATNGNGQTSPYTDSSNNPVSLQTNAAGAVPVAITPQVPVGGTFKSFTGPSVALSAGGTTATALYTVTAGKTFYITDIYLAIKDTAGASTELAVAIQAAGVSVFSALCSAGSATKQGINCQMAGMDTGPQGTTAQAMTILWPLLTATANGYYYIAGMEV